MENDNSPVIEMSGISKTYDTVTALSDINIVMQRGTVTGLVGPDGAGKSTLIRIILTLLYPDSGYLRVFGLDSRKNKLRIRSRVGYMPETFSLYSDLTVEENLLFSFRIHRMDSDLYQTKLDRQYEFNKLRPFAHARTGTLSGGMKQKLALSCAMMHDPDLLVLDEPTTGVDPLSRREFWQMLHELKIKGLSIFVSTPYMDEALQCDQVYFMFNGSVVNSGSPAELISSFSGSIYEITIGDDDVERIAEKLKTIVPEAAVYLSGKNIHLGTYTPHGENFKTLIPKDAFVRSIQPNLEDLFMMRILQIPEQPHKERQEWNI